MTSTSQGPVGRDDDSGAVPEVPSEAQFQLAMLYAFLKIYLSIEDRIRFVGFPKCHLFSALFLWHSP